MDEISAAWLYPTIIVAGALQAWGPPMDGALRNSLTNPWLASVVSFLPVVAFLSCVFLCVPRPIPTVEGLNAMPWWAPLGGLIGGLRSHRRIAIRRQGRRGRSRRAYDNSEHPHVARNRQIWLV
jgi:Putative inner membrane exporter, YdcZ